jgi:hypothetical protein
MSKIPILLFLAFAAYGQPQRIAILNTEDDVEPHIGISELLFFTAKFREIANDILPRNQYGLMTQQSIVDRLGSEERAVKECREATCLADLGRKISADYIAQARIGRFGGNLTIKAELYDVRSSNLIASFTGESKDIHGLLSILEVKAPNLLRNIIAAPAAMSSSSSISRSSSSYEIDYTHNYSYDTFTDSRDGQKYKAIKIGNLTWMAENLKYKASKSICYDNLESKCSISGRLYNWATAIEACPPGWHLPSKAEWDALIELKAMKAFSAIPGGLHIYKGTFYHSEIASAWWSSSDGKENFLYVGSGLRNGGISWNSTDKRSSCSVRCVKD